MNQSKNQEPFSKRETSNGGKAWGYFWGTILFLAGVTFALIVIGSFRPETTQAPSSPAVTEIKPTRIEEFLSRAARAGVDHVKPRIDPLLEDVYAPVYAAIPVYADFHYSVLGEYVELSEAAFGTMSEALYTRLFDGFEQRLNEAVSTLDQEYYDAYLASLESDIKKEFGPNASQVTLGPVTQAIIEGAIDRYKITAPLGAVAASIVGVGATKKVTAVMAKKLAGKIAAKAAAKGVAKGAVKGGGVLAGATGGATLCSWTGPGAAVCGIAGGVAAWLLTDAVIVNLDEYFNRSDFESELRKMIDEHKALTKQRIMAALKEKSRKMDEVGRDVTGEFTLRELSTGTADAPSKP